MLANRGCLLLAAAASLCVCGVAHANSLAPFAWFWPGVLHVSIVYSFPATVLAALIERDFVRLPGERRGSLVLSLRANLISTIVGILLIPVAMYLLYTPILPPAAFAISCWVEIAYLKRFVDPGYSARRLVLGNAISAGTLIVIPIIAEVVKELRPVWPWLMQDYWIETLSVACAVSAVILVAAWFVPAPRREEASSPLSEVASDEIAADEDGLRDSPAETHFASSK
jgi:hypothetical protein